MQKPSRKAACARARWDDDPPSAQKGFEGLLEGLAVPAGAETGPLE